jgi:hypothetical protein
MQHVHTYATCTYIFYIHIYHINIHICPTYTFPTPVYHFWGHCITNIPWCEISYSGVYMISYLGMRFLCLHLWPAKEISNSGTNYLSGYENTYPGYKTCEKTTSVFCPRRGWFSEKFYLLSQPGFCTFLLYYPGSHFRKQEQYFISARKQLQVYILGLSEPNQTP